MAERKSGRLPMVIAAVTLWLALSLGWSWVLLRFGYDRFAETSLAGEAQRLSALLTGDPAHDQPLLEQAAALAPGEGEGPTAGGAAGGYLMTWTSDGLVVAHTRRSAIGTFLDPAQWPALDAAQPSRLSTLRGVEEFTTRVPGAARWPADGRGESRPLFLSVARDRRALDRQYWRSAGPLLLAALGFAAAGSLALAGIFWLAFRRLDATRREIEQTARARTSLLTERGMLASVLAHEVRSPLTALRFNLHSLRGLLAGGAEASAPDDDAAPPDKRVELTDRCEREIRRLDGMLNDFLQRTQVHTEPEPASLNRVIREAIEFLGPTLEQRNIRVSLHLDAADPHVHVHPDELRQVILNLAANAMDAMPAPRGGTLAISTLAPGEQAAAGTAPLPAGGPPITLLIRDSGVGIPADQLERIFEPFFSTKPNGSGLGLTLVRRVISGAGGTLFVESTVAGADGANSGAGTTFRILLPPAGAHSEAGRGYAHTKGPSEG